MGLRRIGTTVTQRFSRASDAASAISSLPGLRHNSEMLVAGKVVPMAIYGTPATLSHKAAMSRLRSRIATVVGRSAATNRSVDLALGCTQRVLDPE
eukprot:12277558-Alexandrium_andersonii.AAC.1